MRLFVLPALLITSCTSAREAERERPRPPSPTPLTIIRIAAPSPATANDEVVGQVGLGDAGSVASRVGDHVRFQDTIVGISMAKAKPGAYLSFGAPYPKQALSVFVPIAIYDGLPSTGHLLKREVRVSGVVRSSPTGPLIDVSALDQFALLDVNETILSRRDLETPTAIDHFIAATRQVKYRKDIDVLERLGNDLHAMGPRDRYGRMRSAFFDALNCEDGGLLSLWRARHPQSIFPQLLEAGAHLCAGWSARGSDTADKVTPDQWKALRHHAGEARRILARSNAGKAIPEYFVLMQRIALAEQWPQGRYFALFEEAQALERDYLEAQIAAAHFLLPKWHGLPGDWERFLAEQRTVRGAPDGEIIYALVAVELAREREYHRRLFAATAISWEAVASGLEALIERGRGARYYKSVYGMLAWEARDHRRLRAALHLIGDDPDMEVWANLQDLESAARFLEHERAAEMEL